MRANLRTSIAVIGVAIMSSACSSRQAGSTATIDGTLAGRTLTLTITRDYGLRETFTGTLADATHLVGTLGINGQTQSFGYARR